MGSRHFVPTVQKVSREKKKEIKQKEILPEDAEALHKGHTRKGTPNTRKTGQSEESAKASDAAEKKKANEAADKVEVERIEKAIAHGKRESAR